MPYTLFLSHSAGDADLVRQLTTRFRASGIEVYIYEDDPQAGATLATKLVEAIRGSDGVVALLTRQGANRASVQQEVGAAVALGRPVFAMVEDGVHAAAFALLQGLEYIRLDLTQFAEAMTALERSVAARREKVRTALLLMLVVIAAIVVGYFLVRGDG